MRNYTAERLYELLPAVYRRRDAELDYPLRDLVAIIAEQATVLEEDISRLYENWFIETCDPWVVPYIGDLIGVRGIYPARFGRRAEVANTIGYRRRKGTAAMLEQLARDSTGWPARVVEFFELLATTQHLNHLRPQNLWTPDLRRAASLEHLDGPFDSTAHTAEVRRIVNRRGRYNIPNIGLFLWRLDAYPLAGVTPHKVDDGTDRHYTFNVLGLDERLFNDPLTETSPDYIAGELNVPAPIRRRALHEDTGAYYGMGRSIDIRTKSDAGDWNPVALATIVACDLSDWTRKLPAHGVAVDPVLGRLAFSAEADAPSAVEVTYHHGFSADIGGGQYEREASFTEIGEDAVFKVGGEDGVDTIKLALAAWGGNGSAVILIQDSRTYREAVSINIPEGRGVEIRAVNEQRPTLLLDGELEVSGGDDSGFEINGLLIAKRPLRIGRLGRLRLQHCTLVPGMSFNADATAAPSLIVEAHDPEVTIERSILGALRSSIESRVTLRDSILDAGDRGSTAYAAPGDDEEGGTLTVARSTVIGTVHTRQMSLGENSIFLGKVLAERRQAGCVRFSFVASDSQVPRCYRCQPRSAAGTSGGPAESGAAPVAPIFTSLRYGDPGYCQLARHTPDEIRRGAEDESEMGVFSSLQQPQREENLRIRLDEYLRAGLEAGIFFVT